MSFIPLARHHGVNFSAEVVGTVSTMAPEVFSGRYNEKLDAVFQPPTHGVVMLKGRGCQEMFKHFVVSG
jgi:hypothetical protein